MDGALHFTQSSLSRAIHKRSELEARSQSNPTALSSKRARIVTRPDVERALILWVYHMLETKKETVSGPMLREKQKRYEENHLSSNMGAPFRVQHLTWAVSYADFVEISDLRREDSISSKQVTLDAFFGHTTYNL